MIFFDIPNLYQKVGQVKNSQVLTTKEKNIYICQGNTYCKTKNEMKKIIYLATMLLVLTGAASCEKKTEAKGPKKLAQPTTGVAEIIGGTKVKWVQLWADGPKWAEYNVGATSVGECGGYYCWGRTIDKDPTGDYYNKYENIQGTAFDTAKNLWGDNWQMPTYEDYCNLCFNCDMVWVTDYNGTGMDGLLFTGTTEGYTNNSVFFQIAGGYIDGEISHYGIIGLYWSSTPDDYGSEYAYSFVFNSQLPLVGGEPRKNGYSVRAVLK